MKRAWINSGLFILAALAAGCASQPSQPWGNTQDYLAQRSNDQSAFTSQCFASNDPYCYDPGPPEVVIVEQRRGFGPSSPGPIGLPPVHFGR